MTTFIKSVIALVLAVIIGGAIYGAYQYPQVQAVLGSPTGTTFNTAKMAAISMTPVNSAASSTSLLNTDASGRWVSSIDVDCTNNVASNAQPLLFLQAATTSVSGIGLNGNTNLVGNLAIATGTIAFVQSASSTIASATSQNTDFYYWPSNTYLSFLFTATTSGACVVAAKYIPS